MNRNTGRFALLRQLRADGIDCMFGNPGTSEQNLLDALTDDEFRDFRYYLALHEGTAVAMADGYARARQRPAVVQLHSYAGLSCCCTQGMSAIEISHACVDLVALFRKMKRRRLTYSGTASSYQDYGHSFSFF